MARARKPSFIFFDEVDSLVLARTSNDSQDQRSFIGELLVQMDGPFENDGVFVLAATNTPENLDISFIRRFSKMVYVGLPDFAARCKIFETTLPNFAFDVKDYELFAKHTQG